MSGLSLGAYLKQVNMFVVYFPRIEQGVKLFVISVTNSKITRDKEIPQCITVAIKRILSGNILH